MSALASMFSHDNFADFSATFERYWKLTRGSRADALSHTAKNYIFFAKKRLMAKAAPKGAVTKERIAALKAGEGIKISERAREIVYRKFGVQARYASGYKPAPSNIKLGKSFRFIMVGSSERKSGFSKKQSAQISKLNSSLGGGNMTIQALLAEQELKLRESHRMFTASSAQFKGALDRTTFATTKASKQLGRARPMKGGEDADRFEFDWSGEIGKWSGIAAIGLTSAARRGVHDPALRETRADMLVYIARKQKEAASRAAATIRRG